MIGGSNSSRFLDWISSFEWRMILAAMNTYDDKACSSTRYIKQIKWAYAIFQKPSKEERQVLKLVCHFTNHKMKM